MAKHLDLEEQEQLDQLKAFWARWGAPIVWLLIVVFGALAAWNGWQYWQRRQAAQASVLFEEVERAVQASDLPRLERSLGDMQGRYPKTVLTQQASLLAAKTQFDKGNAAAAKTALAWAADQGSDAALRAVARLRLAALAMDAKAYDDALKHLQASWPAPFEALAADRRGDVYALQGKRDEATGEYRRAWGALEERSDSRRLVEAKLNALGVDPRAVGTPATAAAATAAAAVKP